MEEKLRILEDLNMLYIRQIALSLQVKALTFSFPPSMLLYEPVIDYTNVNLAAIFYLKSLGVRAVYCGGCLMW